MQSVCFLTFPNDRPLPLEISAHTTGMPEWFTNTGRGLNDGERQA